MKSIEKSILALTTWGFVAFLVTDPFKWGTDDGVPTRVTTFQWVLFGIVTHLLLRIAFVNYKSWIVSQPKVNVARNSRSHFNQSKGSK